MTFNNLENVITNVLFVNLEVGDFMDSADGNGLSGYYTVADENPVFSYNNINLITSSGLLDSDQLEISYLFTGLNAKKQELESIFILPKSVNNEPIYELDSNTKQITIRLDNFGELPTVTLDSGEITIPDVIESNNKFSGIRIRRKTYSAAKFVDFQAGSRLSPASLNLQSDQLLYLLQELNGNIIGEYVRVSDSQASDGFVSLDTDQTITGEKTFANSETFFEAGVVCSDGLETDTLSVTGSLSVTGVSNLIGNVTCVDGLEVSGSLVEINTDNVDITSAVAIVGTLSLNGENIQTSLDNAANEIGTGLIGDGSTHDPNDNLAAGNKDHPYIRATSDVSYGYGTPKPMNMELHPFGDPNAPFYEKITQYGGGNTCLGWFCGANGANPFGINLESQEFTDFQLAHLTVDAGGQAVGDQEYIDFCNSFGLLLDEDGVIIEPTGFGFVGCTLLGSQCFTEIRDTFPFRQKHYSGGLLDVAIGACTGVGISNTASSVLVGAFAGSVDYADTWAGTNLFGRSDSVFIGAFAGTNTCSQLGVDNPSEYGSHNIGIGSASGSYIRQGYQNVCIGSSCLSGIVQQGSAYDLLNTAVLPVNNTAVGFQALGSSVGVNNTSIGSMSLNECNFGDNNTAIGFSALQTLGSLTAVSKANTSSNTAIGSYAGSTLGTAASKNTIIGADACKVQLSGSFNTVIGMEAYSAASGGGNNTAVGYQSLIAVTTTASSNTGVGFKSLRNVTTGGSNTSIGYQSGGFLTSGSNNTCIGNGSDTLAIDSANSVTLGNSAITMLRCKVQSITLISDRRDKKDITEIPVGLSFINELKPVAFVWNQRDGNKVGPSEFGFIAQDLIEAQETIGTVVPGLVSSENPDRLEAAYGYLLPVIVKAIQELSIRLTTLESKIQ